MRENTDNACWIDAVALDELENGSLTTIRHDDKQLVLVRRKDGATFALDNKCPHEGYALAQGELKGDKLTCCWHNWKFDVTDGSCILGGEGVRSYATRENGGRVEIDISDPDPETLYPALLDSLTEGLFKHENGRCVRDGIRLLNLGYSPWDLLAFVAHYDALHAEYGTTHALPVAADCGRLLGRLKGTDGMYSVVHAIDVCGDGSTRMPERDRPQPVAGGTLKSIRALAEAEDVRGAESQLLGAFDAGISHGEIESWLQVVFSDHFTGFGHQAIYLVKARELLSQTDGRFARDIYGSLLVNYILATREDTLPYMKSYRLAMVDTENELSALFQAQDADAVFDEGGFRNAVLDSPPHKACTALVETLRSGVPGEIIAQSLVAAGAERMMRFDPAVENDPGIAENWVWVTHRFTHACAVHRLIQRHPGPDSLRYLFHALAFINSGKRMDIDASAREDVVPVAGGVADLLGAIEMRDTQKAMGIAIGMLETPNGYQKIKVLLEDLSIKDVVIRPIVVAHLIKTAAAAIETFDDFEGHAGRAIGLLATIRFLTLGHKERRMHDLVTSSLGWVIEGKIPKKLTQ